MSAEEGTLAGVMLIVGNLLGLGVLGELVHTHDAPLFQAAAPITAPDTEPPESG